MSRKTSILLGGSEGRMGKILQKLISETEDFEVLNKFDPKDKKITDISDVIKKEKRHLNEMIDVYVDFTTPKAVLENVKKASQIGIDSVIGTTGWYDHIETVKELAIQNGRRILYSPNFSPGVNVLFYVTKELARLLGNFGYDVMVREIHHTGKADAPSGTAMALGNFLKEEMEKKKNLAYKRREKKVDDEIDVIGGRIGRIAGHHEVWFTPEESYSERLILQHDVFTPEIFGLGVLMGIRWMIKAQKTGKPPGLYNFYEDVLEMS